jgi:tetratricopeptide (TPR) repeat protein
LALLSLQAGCATTQHEISQDQAKRRWAQVRGQVKLQLAQKQYASGLMAQCESSVAEALALNPGDPTALRLLAIVHLEQNRLASAQSAIDAAREAAGPSAELTYLEGVILEQRRAPNEALAKFTEAFNADPTHIDYLTARVETLVSLGRLDEASELLAMNAGGTDDRTSVAVLAGRVAQLLGDVDEAAAWLSDAMIASGDDPMIAAELGLLLTDLGRYDEGLALLNALAVEQEDGSVSPSIVQAIARCEMGLRDPAAAQRTLQNYVKSNPEDATGQLLLAKAAIAAGNVGVAMFAVDRAGRDDPTRTEILFVQAVIDRARGRLQRSEEGLRQLLQVTPADVDAHCLLGEILLARGDHDGGRQQFETALAINHACAWASASLAALVATSPADPQHLARTDPTVPRVSPNETNSSN